MNGVDLLYFFVDHFFCFHSKFIFINEIRQNSQTKLEIEEDKKKQNKVDNKQTTMKQIAINVSIG